MPHCICHIVWSTEWFCYELFFISSDTQLWGTWNSGRDLMRIIFCEFFLPETRLICRQQWGADVHSIRRGGVRQTSFWLNWWRSQLQPCWWPLGAVHSVCYLQLITVFVCRMMKAMLWRRSLVCLHIVIIRHLAFRFDSSLHCNMCGEL